MKTSLPANTCDPRYVPLFIATPFPTRWGRFNDRSLRSKILLVSSKCGGVRKLFRAAQRQAIFPLSVLRIEACFDLSPLIRSMINLQTRNLDVGCAREARAHALFSAQTNPSLFKDFSSFYTSFMSRLNCQIRMNDNGSNFFALRQQFQNFARQSLQKSWWLNFREDSTRQFKQAAWYLPWWRMLKTLQMYFMESYLWIT